MKSSWVFSRKFRKCTQAFTLSLEFRQADGVPYLEQWNLPQARIVEQSTTTTTTPDVFATTGVVTLPRRNETERFNRNKGVNARLMLIPSEYIRSPFPSLTLSVPSTFRRLRLRGIILRSLSWHRNVSFSFIRSGQYTTLHLYIAHV